jgi:hypothetical protein
MNKFTIEQQIKNFIRIVYEEGSLPFLETARPS